jgi:hypothetical protein
MVSTDRNQKRIVVDGIHQTMLFGDTVRPDKFHSMMSFSVPLPALGLSVEFINLLALADERSKYAVSSSDINTQA